MTLNYLKSKNMRYKIMVLIYFIVRFVLYLYVRKTVSVVFMSRKIYLFQNN